MVMKVRYNERNDIKRSLVKRDLVMEMIIIWCIKMENRIFIKMKKRKKKELRKIKERDVKDVVLLYMMMRR
jgi:hypothetical protein